MHPASTAVVRIIPHTKIGCLSISRVERFPAVLYASRTIVSATHMQQQHTHPLHTIQTHINANIHTPLYLFTTIEKAGNLKLSEKEEKRKMGELGFRVYGLGFRVWRFRVCGVRVWYIYIYVCVCVYVVLCIFCGIRCMRYTRVFHAKG